MQASFRLRQSIKSLARSDGMDFLKVSMCAVQLHKTATIALLKLPHWARSQTAQMCPEAITHLPKTTYILYPPTMQLYVAYAR